MEVSQTSTLLSVSQARDRSWRTLALPFSPSRPAPPTYIGFSCCSLRRHHRRRDMRLDSKLRGPSREDGISANEARGVHSDKDSVVITLDLHHMKQRAEALTEAAKKAVQMSAVRAVRLSEDMLNDGRMFLEDLRSSVSIQRDRRVVISLRRSSIDFALSALLWSALLVAALKILVTVAKRYRWGWEESFNSRRIVKRDRSLGGREVFVGKNASSDQRTRREKQDTGSARKKVNPLDAVEISRSEKDLSKQRESKSLREKHNRLPGWWPHRSTLLSTSLPIAGGQALQERASFLLKMIIEKRSTGKDFEEDDVLQLRRMCKDFGTRVAFDSAYVRDSFYRAAVGMVLSSCARSETLGMVGGERAGEFLAGLADNISLEAERAAVMVNAAVAARTRSSFLQAWAFHVQGKVLEAEVEVTRLSNILFALPPDKNSPEMEMVAQGLGKHLSFDERSRLSDFYLKVGRSSTERSAFEALGLHSTKKWS